MDKEELENSIKQALDCEFNISNGERQIQIYETSKALGYDKQCEEMRRELVIEGIIEPY